MHYLLPPDKVEGQIPSPVFTGGTYQTGKYSSGKYWQIDFSLPENTEEILTKLI